MTQKTIAILYSGGLDSSLMYLMAKHQNPDAEVIAVFFDHGQDSVKAEMERLPEHVKVHKIDWLSETVRPRAKASMPLNGAIYIPGRNMVFATLAASLYVPDEVWLGAVREDNNEAATDKNERFRAQATELMSSVLAPFKPNGVKLVYPISDNDFTKIDLMNYCIDNDLITPEQIGETTSCWHNISGVQCGMCAQCVKRALYTRNFDVPEKWENPVLNNPDNKFASDLIRKYRTYDSGTFEDRLNMELVKHYDQNLKMSSTKHIKRD